jgi:hypothetical protein
MSYDVGQPFIEVTFPTRSVKKALFRREDVLRVIETKTPEGDPLVTIFVKSLTSGKDYIEWYFDGTMENFRESTKTVYL